MWQRNNLVPGSMLVVTALVGLFSGCAPKVTSTDYSPSTEKTPETVLYQRTKPCPIDLKAPRGICTYLNGFYVVGDQKLLFYTTRGLSGAPVALKGEPRCVVANGSSGVIVGCGDFVSFVDGNKVKEWPSFGSKTLITSLILTKDALWVADSGNRRVLKCSLDGKQITELGKKTDDYPGLVIPSPHFDLAALPNGDVMWTNPGAHRVEIHDANGKMKSFWGKSSQEPGGFCGCCNPTDIAILPDGRVVTSEKGFPRVSVYKDETFQGFVAKADDRSEKAVGLDLAVNKDDIYVLDPFAKDVTIYKPMEVKR